MHDYDLDNKRQYEIDFHSGVVSKQAREYWKDYWYNEFKLGDGIVEQSKNVPVMDMKNLPCDLCYLVDGTYEKYERYLIDNPDRPISFDNWKYMIENYKGESSNIIHKHIGVIGHVDHGKSIIVGETGVDDRIVASAHNIQSIVPIADIIPEPIIPKQEFLKMHDKAVERSITEETYRESRAWDIKKEKKVSHKRNNKRK